MPGNYFECSYGSIFLQYTVTERLKVEQEGYSCGVLIWQGFLRYFHSGLNLNPRITPQQILKDSEGRVQHVMHA